MTPESSTLHIQQVLAVLMGSSRCPDWQALLGEGQPERCLLWGCLSQGHMRGEEREGQGPDFLFFVLKLFNLRGWRWENFSLAG